MIHCSRALAISFLLVGVLIAPLSQQRVQAYVFQLPDASVNASAVVVRVKFGTVDELNRLAAYLDIWELDHENHSFVALLSQDEYEGVTEAGFDVTVLPVQTAMVRSTPLRAAEQTTGIPGYPCCRTVEETYRDLALLAMNHPQLASWTDIGDSWEKTDPGPMPGYDLFSLVLTNQYVPGPKPKLAVLSAIHARELTTAELATRFVERLVAQYGIDPDITWLLDHTELHLIPHANPDGRKQAEAGAYWRKNTHSSSSCSPTTIGVDLNRNSSFKWNGCDGANCSSDEPCSITYRGQGPTSEPETGAIEAYLSSIFDDQRGPEDADAAPADAEGAFVSLHSYGQLIIYPWGWTDMTAPNGEAHQTLARKFGFFTGYDVCQIDAGTCLYLADGATTDWAYGELGIAAFTFELGSQFFEQCTFFENSILDESIDALLYAMKASRRPYQTPSGPEITVVGLDADTIQLGDPLSLQAVADDTRFASNGHGEEPVQAIAAARYTLDAPSWISGTSSYSMTVHSEPLHAQDVQTATVSAVVDTTGLGAGRHLLLVEAADADGHWGVPSAVFFEVQALVNYLPTAFR